MRSFWPCAKSKLSSFRCVSQESCLCVFFFYLSVLNTFLGCQLAATMNSPDVCLCAFWTCAQCSLWLQVDGVRNLSESFAYVSFGIVLFVWEVLPISVVVFFFRVKRQSSAVVSIEVPIHFPDSGWLCDRLLWETSGTDQWNCVSLWFLWSAPLVSHSNWFDRQTESKSGLGPLMIIINIFSVTSWDELMSHKCCRVGRYVAHCLWALLNVQITAFVFLHIYTYISTLILL